MKKGIDWTAALGAFALILVLGIIGAAKEPVFYVLDAINSLGDTPEQQQ